MPGPCQRCSPWGWGFPVLGFPCHAAPLNPQHRHVSGCRQQLAALPQWRVLPCFEKKLVSVHSGVLQSGRQRMQEDGSVHPGGQLTGLSAGEERPPARDKCHLAHGCMPPQVSRAERVGWRGLRPQGGPAGCTGAAGVAAARWAVLTGGRAPLLSPPWHHDAGESGSGGGCWERGSCPHVVGTGAFGSSLPHGKSVTDCFHAI